MSNPYHQPSAARPLLRMKRVWAGGLLLLLIGTGCGALGSDDTAKTGAKPAPTATVTATATVTVTATPAAAPASAAPTVTATKTVTATATVTREAAANDSSSNDDSGSGGSSNDSGGASVYYGNCSEARAAGAAPVHRGEPGYGRHLDRDNDGVGCDNG
ncbi:excalibur calcium-binding domain-containing protein [Streptomyces sp. NPDC006307]|uniref:excalibur calcium-binding domain-containing protein n=1 Tax=Streptomyces sp. NPDC006307 TaxID=3156748 RepID=UPI0033A16B71